ncbi:Mucin-associated surface protein (MASP) [Trypanosoma cruzi]|uniref:Mucin-associated surface protein (MASP), putative n=2 Tax=Trypanosoma cruzi TaxID=5693 RepID=Q4DP76_TRYCC|nr:mucin-associated surface protein (MASP), putative [Trypanosoma cruzi]EAN94331.1 mucin-associated surface protein (MASP), putative [Trypanosoma cruzi]PWV17727.1 Mucin-associated surface protein (MASP) [Trypanosoma cruzi]|eukprot:XP_816182.1 mucin-associated surface protein (MASP) [Trypanosoma cruzi strain CL Brener]
MAMMMAGRVLLVCALCVLWCGAGGGYAEDVDVAVGGPGTFGEGGGGAGGQSPPADGSRGGSRGSKADGSHLGEGDASDSASDDISLALSPELDVVPTLSEEPLPQEEEESEGKQKHPQTGPQDASTPKVNGRETIDPDPQKQLSDKSKTESITNVGGGETADGGKENNAHNNGLSSNKSDPQPLLEPRIKKVSLPTEPSPPPAELSPAPPELPTVPSPTGLAPATTVSAGETNPTPSTGSQNTTGTTSKTSTSNAKTKREAQEKSSGNVAPNQNRQDTDTPDSMRGATTSRPAETAVPSVSKIGSGGTQNKEDKVDNGAQRPNTREPQYGLEDDTDDAHTASETELQTPGTATTQNNASSKSGGTDSSTAASHTTSPLLLLLLLVACAAAAAVVAA